LGLGLVNGFAVRRQLLGLPPEGAVAEREYWLLDANAARADEARIRGATPDDALDLTLLRRLHAGPPAVFDSWFLPWLAPRTTFAICLEVAIDVRVGRIARDVDSTIDNLALHQSVRAKDLRSAEYAHARYGIDILSDRSPFDVIVSVTIDAEREAVTDLLVDVAAAALGTVDNPDHREGHAHRFDLLARCPPAIKRSLARA